MSHELFVPMIACAGVTFLCWLLSVIFDEYSWVDRIWSIVPPLYVGWFAAQAQFMDARLDIMLGLALLWGARLTFNFARKGGYAKGGEDYRWAIVRKRLGKPLFQVFNVTFIALYQNFLLLAITLPAYTALQHPAPLQALDFVAAGAFLLFLIGETVADEQQWRFYKRKKAEGLDFNSEGLFKYSRHPNFLCEQVMWWCIYGFAVAATGEWLHWTMAGTVLLTLLFQGSTAFTELISSSKYPRYAEYTRTTSRMIPLPTKA